MAILKIQNENGEWIEIPAIQGAPGKDGVDGKDGNDGGDGYTPIKGIDYFDGEQGPQGEPGKDGVDGKDGENYIITGEDYEDIATIVETNIQPTINEIRDVAEQAENIARGRATGYVFDTLDDLNVWLQNDSNKTGLVLGDNFYIRATDVPDYWWDGTSAQKLEGEKPDFTGYVKETDYATSSEVGLVKANGSGGITVNSAGNISVVKATDSDITAKTNNYKPIVPSNLDYAVGSVKASETQFGTIKAWMSENEDGEIGLNISTEV